MARVNKKLCAACDGLLELKTAAPLYGGRSRISVIVVTLHCPVCDLQVVRRMTTREFRDYTETMKAVNNRELHY